MEIIKKSLLLSAVLASGVSIGGFGEELFKLKWKRYVGKENFINMNHPLIYKRYVLHATNGDKDGKDPYDKLYVFDQNGNLLWSFEGSKNVNGVVACDDFIVVGDDNGYIYSLTWDGKVRWKRKAGDIVAALSLGDLNGDGIPDVVAGSWDHYVYAFSGKNGSLLWKFGTGRDVASSPAIADLNDDGVLDVVVGSKDHYIYALSGDSGRLLWKFKTGDWVRSSPAIADLNSDGVLDVVVGSWDDYIYALSGDSGRLLWKFKTGNNVASSPAIADLNDDGVLDVVVGSWDYYIYALSGDSGKLLWKFKTGNGIVPAPALGDVDGDGKLDLAVVSWDGYLYLFEATTLGGKVVWARFHGDGMGTGYYPNAVKFGESFPKPVIKIGGANKTFDVDGYVFNKGDTFAVMEDNGWWKVIYPKPYEGLYIKENKNWSFYNGTTPVGVNESATFPFIRFRLFFKPKGEVEKITLVDRRLGFIKISSGILTSPVTQNGKKLKGLTVRVFYKDGQTKVYYCSLDNLYRIKCQEFQFKIAPWF